jgi:hypothetical protein
VGRSLCTAHGSRAKLGRAPVSIDFDETAADHYLESWPCNFRLMINAVIESLRGDVFVDRAKEKSIDSPHWLQFTNAFRRTVIKDPLSVFKGDKRAFLRLCRLLQRDVDADDANDMVFSQQLQDFLAEYCTTAAEGALAGNIQSYKLVKSCSDLSMPSAWYPFARILKRKIVFHGGPTNSGKVPCLNRVLVCSITCFILQTHQAFARLREADADLGGGVYCGPLRLLALEIYERMNREGVRASLLTGQERRDVPLATHVSCTVEMVNIGKRYDIAVVDEIQMIGDQHRGHSW